MQHGTITAAAAAVNLSLPAASARLKALEGATGARLLERSKAGVAPTDAGRALARHANRVMAELESLHVDMASFGHGLRGTLRLLCNTAAMSEALPSQIGRFLSSTPDLDVDVQELPSEAVIDALRRGTADVGIVADHVDTSGLLVKPWLEDRLVALLPSGYAIGRRRSVAYGELLEKPLVGLPRDSGLSRFLAAQASRSGRVPRHRVRLGGFDAVARLVAAGAGAAVMPESAAIRYRDPGTRVLPLSDAWASRRLLICITSQGAELHTVRALVDALLLTSPGA
jgi:DNA-binding transcriptional LysR family regulator